MNESTIERLIDAAQAIEKLRNLHSSEQQWLEPILTKTTKTALNILDAIANTPLSYEEIADICELHPTTVRQILYALKDGGCNIDLSTKTAFAPTGRPRTLARR